ncbi:PLP-dependent transferase, partial [Staphylococcus auricularis]|uniref:PLP-dependent transferase n=1 Tax=Staphylococcus auricularis TaxID=29379 RepID=UPI00177D790D
YLSTPLQHAPHILLHSPTKYIPPHNHLLPPLLTLKHQTLPTPLHHLHNIIPPTLSPFHTYFLLPPLKTLHLPLHPSQQNPPLLPQPSTHLHSINDLLYTPHTPIFTLPLNPNYTLPKFLQNLKISIFPQTLR